MSEPRYRGRYLTASAVALLLPPRLPPASNPTHLPAIFLPHRTAGRVAPQRCLALTARPYYHVATQAQTRAGENNEIKNRRYCSSSVVSAGGPPNELEDDAVNHYPVENGNAEQELDGVTEVPGGSGPIAEAGSPKRWQQEGLRSTFMARMLRRVFRGRRSGSSAGEHDSTGVNSVAASKVFGGHLALSLVVRLLSAAVAVAAECLIFFVLTMLFVRVPRALVLSREFRSAPTRPIAAARATGCVLLRIMVMAE